MRINKANSADEKTARLISGLALFGDSRKDGKITLHGKVALALLIIGFVSAAALEVVSEFERRALAVEAQAKEKLDQQIATQKVKEAQRVADINQMWEIQLQQPLIMVHYRLFTLEAKTREEFVKLANKIEITFHSFPVLTTDGVATRTLHFNLDPEEADAEKAIKLTFRSPEGDYLSMWPEVALLKKLNKSPFGKADKTDDGILLAWGMSVEDDWTDPMMKIGGLQDSAPWQITNLQQDIKTIENISRLRWINIKTPRDFNWAHIHECRLIFYAAGNSATEIDIKNLTYLESTDSTVSPLRLSLSATVYGNEILGSWKSQFMGNK